MITSFFRIWTSQQQLPKKSYLNFQRTPHLPPPLETSPNDTWIQSLVTNFLSFNPCQYESNRHKQDLLITKSKMSHYMLQIIKSQNLRLVRPAITHSTHSRSKHTPTSHFQSTFQTRWGRGLTNPFSGGDR